MNIEDALAQIGISGKRARFYLAALEMGQAPVQVVARKAGISRTTAYDVLARLAEDGLVSKVEKDVKYHIIVEDPKRLIAVLDDRRRTVEGLLPELRSLYNLSTLKPRIRFYEGREGLKTVLYDTLQCRNGQLLGILSMADLLEVPGRAEMDEYIARRIALGIHLRVVRSRIKDAGDQVWPTSAAHLRELRYAPDGMVFTMTTWIYDEKVSIISSRREHFGMIIESEEFGHLMKNLFMVLWHVSLPAAAPSSP
jgi:sugar-specific transcriptional regulator TrmB